MNLRTKGLGMLKANVVDLPFRIAIWRKNGNLEQAARAEAILRESLAEIARRERVKVGLPA